MKAPRHVLVTGATGAVGPCIVKLLHDAGMRIRTFSRNMPPPGFFPNSIDVRTGDIVNAAAIKAAMKGIDAVLHLAGLLHIVNPSPALKAQYEQINVVGTDNVVEKARQEGVNHVVFFSTIAIYGPSNGLLLTEESPVHADSYYAQSKYDAEKIVLAAKNGTGAHFGTVLRLSAVYGARVKGNYHRLLMALAHGRFVPIGNGENRRTLVYEEDVAQASLLILQHPESGGNVYNITDGQFHSMNNIIETICNTLGRKPPFLRLPIKPVYNMARIIENASRICRLHPPISRATIEKYIEDMAVDGTKFNKQLGFLPGYDLGKGWQKTIAQMRFAGEL